MVTPLRQYSTHHDVFGIWHLPNAKVLYPGKESKSWYIRTNSIGLRDDRDFDKARPAGKRRILLFGDSFAFGSGINVEDRFSNVIESRYPNVEIMNFGLSSAGIDRQYLVYKHLGHEYEADYVMIAPYLNNTARCTETQYTYQDRSGRLIRKPKPYFDLQNGDIVLKNVPVPREPLGDGNATAGAGGQRFLGPHNHTMKLRLIRKLYLETNYKYWLIRLLPIQPYPEYGSTDHPTWRLGRRILEAFIKECPHKVVIAPLPSWSIIMNPKLASYRARFAELHDPAAGVFVLDILDRYLELGFADKRRCFVSRFDNHYSELGHSVAADGIIAGLEHHHLL